MNTATLEQPVEQEYMGSIVFMNMLGDVTLCWDEQNKDKILKVIQKKMDEGYTFFTTKKFGFKLFSRKIKVSPKNLHLVEEIILTDEQFDKMVDDFNDKDIAELITTKSATVGKRVKKETLVGMTRAKRAEDVIDKNSVALRPIVGG